LDETVMTHPPSPIAAALVRAFAALCAVAMTAAASMAQTASGEAHKIPAPAPATAAATRPGGVATPLPAFVIGPSDVLTVNFWRDKDMSTDVVVRPDGNITLPLLNDVRAAGLTPDELRARIVAEAQRFLEDPSPTVVVKEINSRKVFITGQVEKPGPYPLSVSMTVIQLIAMAGGLKEFADGKNILVMRTENGAQTAFNFDYQQLLKRKNLRQNIELKPGDTVVVP
jgi:polysaccharide biosynthesis/export protein